MRKLVILAAVVLLMASCSLTPASTPTPTITPAPAGTCTLTAVTAVTVYTRPSAAADVFGTLGASESVQPSVRTADGFYGFDPGVAQAGNVGLFRERWVLKTVDVTASPGCASLPTVVAPIAGICYAMIMSDVPVYASPDAASAVLLTLHLEDYAMVVASAPGWYTLDLNVGTAGLDSLGYMQDVDLGGFNGPCEGF